MRLSECFDDLHRIGARTPPTAQTRGPPSPQSRGGMQMARCEKDLYGQCPIALGISPLASHCLRI
jgi:hypothetical protein